VSLARRCVLETGVLCFPTCVLSLPDFSLTCDRVSSVTNFSAVHCCEVHLF
jgi:hypothetical protein